MLFRLKTYQDDKGMPIGDLSTRGDEEAANEKKAVLSGLLDVSLAAGDGEGILGTVYTATPPSKSSVNRLIHGSRRSQTSVVSQMVIK
jgi:hypothetical protein